MAALSPAPIEFETDVLVSGSLEISAAKLASGLSWLATSLKEQNSVLDSLRRRMDSFQDGGAAFVPHVPDAGRLSMKDEMLAMQLNSLKHEVSALPRASDLERLRDRVMGEVQGQFFSTLSDKQRDSHECLQTELAEATDSLCAQLGRIDENVSARLSALEAQLSLQPATAAVPSQRADAPDSGAQAQQAPGLLHPSSASSVAAEDTEDQTDGMAGPEQAGHLLANPAPAPSFGDLVALESRVGSQLEALGRQLTDLAAQFDHVQSTLEVRAEENIKDTADPRNGAQSSAQPPTETTGGLRARERRQSEDAQILAEERQQSSTEAAQVVAGATPAGDYIVKEAIQAASQEARTIAEQMLKHHAESEQMNKEMIASLQCEISSLSMDLKFLQTTQKQDGSTQPTAATKAPETLVEERRVAEDEQSIGEQQAQNCTAIGHNSRTSQQAQPAVNPIDSYPKLSDRIGQLEAFVQRLERAHCTLEERLNNSVPQLEAMVRSLQTAHGNDQVQDQKEDHDHGKELKEKQTETRASELQTEVTEDATLKEFAAPLAQESHPSRSELEKLAERLNDVEELQESADRRLRLLESPQTQAQHGVLEEKRSSCRSLKSEPPSGGTVGGSWKDVQAELEHFRKLFEFIEGVLPRDAAEAMRFFNRRQLGKEVMSQMVSEIFGADVEFQNAKLQLESDFRMHTRELRREFDKLTLAMKALQRDTEGSESKIMDLSKRISYLEVDTGEVLPSGKVPTEDTRKAASPPTGWGTQKEPDQATGEEMRKALQDLRQEVKHWLETFKSSVIQALQTKPDIEQVIDFIKQVAAPSSESIALFAKRQLLGKCASCEAPIDVDLMRVKRPQPIGLQEPWPPGENLGAKVAIRPLNAPLSPSSSRLPKIEPRHRETKKGMKPSASTPELRKEQEPE